MVVNLCAAHKKTDWCAAHKLLLVCFLQSCSTRRSISCSARNKARVLYTKDNSHVTRKFGPSNTTKTQEHTHVAERKCQLRNELYRTKNYSKLRATYVLHMCYTNLQMLLHKTTDRTTQNYAISQTKLSTCTRNTHKLSKSYSMQTQQCSYT